MGRKLESCTYLVVVSVWQSVRVRGCIADGWCGMSVVSWGSMSVVGWGRNVFDCWLVVHDWGMFVMGWSCNVLHSWFVMVDHWGGVVLDNWSGNLDVFNDVLDDWG